MPVRFPHPLPPHLLPPSLSRLSFRFPFRSIHPLNVPKQAHIKSSLIGSSVSVPITNGNLALGTWQGIWFLEFRTGKQRRKVLATVQGVKM